MTWNPDSHQAVGWDVPPPAPQVEREPGPPRKIDVGEWDGKGGFHSSGALDPEESFTVTLTRPGTYAYACVLHPQMVGTLTVK